MIGGKRLFALEVTLEFPVEGVDAERASKVVELVERFSRMRDVPWQVREWDGSNLRLIAEPPRAAIRRVVRAGVDTVQLEREWRNPEWEREVVRYSHGISRPRLCQDARVEVMLADDEQQEEMFVALCDLLQARAGYYVPRFRGPVGWQQHLIVESALERDYNMYGQEWWPESPEMRIARALASVLPRLTFPTPNPTGLPSRLGWLNYWHPDVAEAIGLPDPDKDARILPLCYRTGSGAWVVKLTEEPLDLLQPDHVKALAWAYQRFDKIGRRKPLTKKAKPRVKRAPVGEPEGTKGYVIRERDQSGHWHKSDYKPVRATSADEALRVHFARMMRNRAPKPGESLRKLQDAYDEMAGTIGMTMSVDIDAVEAAQQQPGSTTEEAKTSGASPMPSHSEREIASTALALWDMYVEDSDGPEQLLERVAEGLVDQGLDTERAQAVARMTDAALNGKDSDPASSQDFKTDPIYVALREEIEGGGWDI